MPTAAELMAGTVLISVSVGSALVYLLFCLCVFSSSRLVESFNLLEKLKHK